MSNERELSDIQKDFMNRDAFNAERNAVHESWFNDKTVDYWRHKRMYDTINPFAKKYKDALWITVGDGRFGLDSVRLKKIYGIKSILATDIAENMLRIGKAKRIIDSYKVENAEHLSFGDNTFDVVFCKETFHHFPKPFMGLYEMLRISKGAVILIEPAEKIYTNDVKSIRYLKSAFNLLVSKLLRKPYLPYLPTNYFVEHGYEEAGNYIYTVSVRELERLMHGMALGDLAFKRFSDFYIKGCEFEIAESGNLVLEKMKSMLASDAELCKKLPQYYQPNMITVIIFKKEVDKELKTKMISDGFEFVEKLKNPYL